MTALCVAGGPSGVKPGVVDDLIFATTIAGLVDLAPGMQWLIPFIAGSAVLTYHMPDLCATDPPGFPAFTNADIVALALADPTALGHAARQKVDDLLTTLAWYAFCQCTSGAQPTQPAVPTQPGGYSYVGDPSVAFCTPMLASDTKVLSLWNGTTHNAPPSGWDTVAFNDSTWATGTHAGGTLWPVTNTATPAVRISGAAALDGTTCTPQLVAPASLPSSFKEQFLVRWRFQLPAFDINRLQVELFNPFEGGWSTGTTAVNGTDVVSLGTLNQESQLKLLVPGANVIAFWVNALNSSDAVTWNTHWGISCLLSQSGVSSPITPTAGCCPTDPGVIAGIQAILQAVTLIQRQLAPFAYVAGAVHAGLSGGGTITVQGLLGLSVAVTTIPARAGEVAGDPMELYGVGWLNIGTPDGFGPRIWISSSPMLVLPISSTATVIGYSIPADVVITITELVREPS